jgi:ATP-dependent RNA helicase DDX52/ROK1
MIYRDTPLPHIIQSLVYVSQQESKLPTLLQYLTSPVGYTPPIIVFTSTQARASSLLSELLIAGVKNAEALHAGMTRHEREQCVKRMLQGEIWVLVTTDVLARGMDFGGVQGVINFDWPESVQSYIHRIGKVTHLLSNPIDTSHRKDWSRRASRNSHHILYRRGCSVLEIVCVLYQPL